MATASSDSLMASGGEKISGTTKGITMKCLPDVGIHKETQNQKQILK